LRHDFILYWVWQGLEQNPKAGVSSMKPGETKQENHRNRREKTKIEEWKKKTSKI